ncbi:hypothetical protein Rsub_08142 [Raphidocelis subcapitata]|uniref:MYND-type domain-containing protein n=1 Tax=Raphidocelis subcapitata TaxID=307507 RepID=A0A2V0P5P9_9CHLO|nr:hypothetical protein Rsub_08142 [Raphidocelis subcapitata]|eukprot:GBF94899.1 hypothetical protein Rsub_08142 [Raphidocelis subcapitata]
MADNTAAARSSSSSSGGGGGDAQDLAAALRDLGAALSLKAQSGLAPEVQELTRSWGLRSQALLDAADGMEGVLEGAAAAAAAELLQPLLNEAFLIAHPDLYRLTVRSVKIVFNSFSSEGLPCILGPVGASLLALFLNRQLTQVARSVAAAPLLDLLDRPGCAAALLAAPAAKGAVKALIAVAKHEGAQNQSEAFYMLAQLFGADAAAAERAASALCPLAVERLRSGTAAGAASVATAVALAGPARLLSSVAGLAAPDAVRARAATTPGLAGAVADLLVALGSEEWIAAREVLGAPCDGVEVEMLMVLGALMAQTRGAHAPTFEALTSRGALPRVLALLRSPLEPLRRSAAFCIASIASEERGRHALFKAPRAAVELVAVLRRAHADGEDPATIQLSAAIALVEMIRHSEGPRVAEALARAAAAEGSAGSLLGALAGLVAQSVSGNGCPKMTWSMCSCAAVLLHRIILFATAEQLRVLRRAPLAEPCVRALLYWVPQASDGQMAAAGDLVVVVAVLAGFDIWGESDEDADPGPLPPPATADTAAARAALQGAPGLEGVLQRCLDWKLGHDPEDFFATTLVAAANWLLGLPDAKAAATAAAAAAAPAAAGPAPVDPAAAPAPAAAALLAPPLVAGERTAMQQPGPWAGGSGSGAHGSSSSGAHGSSGSGAHGSSGSGAHDSSGSGAHGGSSGSSASGSGAEAAARPRACGGCGNSTPEAPLLRCVGCKSQYYCGEPCALSHWPSHRAACKAARKAAARRSQPRSA